MFNTRETEPCLWMLHRHLWYTDNLEHKHLKKINGILVELTSQFGLRKVLWRKGTIAWRKCQQRKTLPSFPGRPDDKLMLRCDTSCSVHPQHPSMSLPELRLHSVLRLHPASDQPPRLQHSFQKQLCQQKQEHSAGQNSLNHHFLSLTVTALSQNYSPR